MGFLLLNAFHLCKLLLGFQLFLALATSDDALGAEHAHANQHTACSGNRSSNAHLLSPVRQIVIIVRVVCQLIIAGDELAFRVDTSIVILPIIILAVCLIVAVLTIVFVLRVLFRVKFGTIVHLQAR